MAIDPKHFDGEFIPGGAKGRVIEAPSHFGRDGLSIVGRRRHENCTYLFAWIGIEEMFNVLMADGERRTFWYTNGDRFEEYS